MELESVEMGKGANSTVDKKGSIGVMATPSTNDNS
jgi:hypothetical protein